MNILHLPVEVHLDIFKHLNFDQISSIEQTNGYFRSLINKYIGVLAKKKFYSFETIVYKSVNDKNKYLKLNEEDILHMRLDDIFAWSDDIGEKWKVVVDNKTPMYLFSESLKSKEQYIINFAICLTKEKPKGKGDKSKRLLLKLPYIPKNMKEMFLWRIWLERLFLHCIFEEKIVCENVIFNPIMILVMFNNAIPLVSLKMNYCESGTCADGGQFSFRMFPNFMEDMEKENASKNFPWLHYAKFAQLSCWIFLQDDGTGLGKEKMKNLPNEVKIDIFKCLDFYQLIKARQINKQFCALIDEFKGKLACKRKYRPLPPARLCARCYADRNATICYRGPRRQKSFSSGCKSRCKRCQALL